MPIAKAIAKYGQENFTFEVVEECSTQEELNQAEKAWADKLNSWSPDGYNLRAGNGFGAMTEELKQRISAGNQGKLVTESTRHKLAISHLNQTISAKERVRRSAFMKGKKPLSSLKDGAIRFSQKTYVLRDPEGTLVSFTDMKQFCEEYGYHRGRMSELVQGKRSQYRGWEFVSATPRKIGRRILHKQQLLEAKVVA